MITTNKAYFTMTKPKIVMYNDYFNGMGNPACRNEGKTLKIYTEWYNIINEGSKPSNATPASSPICLISAPLKDSFAFGATSEWSAGNALWGERLASGFSQGVSSVDTFIGNIASLLNQGPDTLARFGNMTGLFDLIPGLKENFQKLQDLAKKGGDKVGSKSDMNWAEYGTSDIVNRFSGGSISSPEININTTIISCESLFDFTSQINFNSNMNAVVGDISNSKLTPLKFYLNILVKFFAPYTGKEGASFRTTAPNSIQYDKIQSYVNGDGSPIEGSFYAKVGKDLIIRNLVPSSLSIKPSKIRTTNGDFLYADVSLTMSSLVKKNLTKTFTEWLK